MDPAQLRRKVSELAFGYVMAGELSQDWLSDQFAPATIPERFRDYEPLVDLHVALDPDVTSYVQNLHSHLRQLKTETRREQVSSRDAVEGRINWPQTYQTRVNTAPGDQALFVTDQRSEAYDVAENLVLKKLLALVYETVTQLEKLDYAWATERWQTGGRNEIAAFKRLYNRNVHLNRISTPDPPLPSERMIEATKTARAAFYRQAAQILDWWQDLRDGSKSGLRELFESTVVEPPENQLFELFVVFRLLKALERRPITGTAGDVRPIAGGGEALAKIGSPSIYLYHNSAAGDRGIRFPSVPAPDESLVNTGTATTDRAPSEWRRRLQAVATWEEWVTSHLWGKDSDRTNRPDALVIQPTPDTAPHHDTSILIVEVKNSTAEDTINRGVHQLLQYIAYATASTGQEDQFLFPQHDDQDAFGGRVHGLLVVQDQADDITLERDVSPISVLQASMLESRLPALLEEIFRDTDSSSSSHQDQF